MPTTFSVCTGGSCSGNGASLAIRDIEELCQGHANVEMSGCLGHCGKGPNCNVVGGSQGRSIVVKGLKKMSKIEALIMDHIEGFEQNAVQKKVAKLKYTARR
ncbi:unnamed protein product, partial [Polarella glacialis]